jgi:hypothetical protein
VPRWINFCIPEQTMISRFSTHMRLLLALVGLLALATGSALAQDPRATAAQAAARAWLALTDAGDVRGSLKAGGKKFQAALDDDSWDEAVKKVRTPLGSAMGRSVVATRFLNKMPDGPDGEYAQILYETNFLEVGQAHETVTLERESDGVWRVIGYYIR